MTLRNPVYCVYFYVSWSVDLLPDGVTRVEKENLRVLRRTQPGALKFLGMGPTWKVLRILRWLWGRRGEVIGTLVAFDTINSSDRWTNYVVSIAWNRHIGIFVRKRLRFMAILWTEKKVILVGFGQSDSRNFGAFRSGPSLRPLKGSREIA